MAEAAPIRGLFEFFELCGKLKVKEVKGSCNAFEKLYLLFTAFEANRMGVAESQ